MTSASRRASLALAAILLVVVTAVVLLRGVLQLYRMPAASMAPGILPGSWIVANGASRDPDVGDAVAFELPLDTGAGSRPHVGVKRVVATAGDEVKVVDGLVVRNGEPAAHCTVGKWTLDDPPTGKVTGTLLVEVVGGAHLVFLADGEPSRTEGPWTVAPGTVWVLGDHRHSSHDSRHFASGAGAGVPSAGLLGTIVYPSGIELPDDASASVHEALASCLDELTN